MAGFDSLVLLDEAHLAPHLRSLLHALRDCTPDSQPLLPSNRSQATLVALTATGEADQTQRFDLDETDQDNAEVKKRLDANKPVEIRVAETGDGAKHLCKAVLDLLHGADNPGGFLVFVNTPKTARDVHGRLLKFVDNEKIGADVLLLTGLMREREAGQVRDQILNPSDGMPATRTTMGRKRHLIVIATQTLEVGADLDAEYLVTEACGVRALTQRLGRLNRLGQYPWAKAIYVHLSPGKSKLAGKGDFWPVYGSEPATVLNRFKQARKVRDGIVNLSPRLIAETLGMPGDQPGRAPELLPGILWEWIKTTTPPEGEAPVEPFFAGIENAQNTVAVFWRSHLPAKGEQLWPRAAELEAVDIRLSAFRDAYTEDSVQRLAGDSVTLEETAVSRLKPGDRVVLPTDCGLLDRFGWSPGATETVVDVSLASNGLPLDATAIKRLCGKDFAEQIRKIVGSDNNELEEIDEEERDKAIKEVLDAIRDTATPPGWGEEEWREFASSLTPILVTANKEVARLTVGNPLTETPVADFDETSLVDEGALDCLATLNGHGDAVGARARSVAECIGLPEKLLETIKFAGDLHDIGKSDGRFQRWLVPDGNCSVAMAKSATPRHRWASTRAEAGWPRGGRHEALSARLVEAWLEANPEWGTEDERNLLLHLIISHHGKGRPMVLPVSDESAKAVSASVAGCEIEVSASLAQVDWKQPKRFRRLNEHFGPWGLALLEAVVIRSDHAVSAAMVAQMEEMPCRK